MCKQIHYACGTLTIITQQVYTNDYTVHGYTQTKPDFLKSLQVSPSRQCIIPKDRKVEVHSLYRVIQSARVNIRKCKRCNCIEICQC